MQKIKGYLERKEGEIVGIASTSAIDRDGESIDQNGWELDNFNQNPVLMVAHDYSEFPVGKCVEIGVRDGKLIFKAVFSQATQKAREAYELVKEGVLSAFSVGFIPKQYDPNRPELITKAELLEISLVPVPANPEAVVMAKNFKSNSLAQYLAKHWELDIEVKENDDEKADETSVDVDPTCPHCGKKADDPVVEATIEVAADENVQEAADEVSDDTIGEDGEKIEDIDLKLLQQTVGHLQIICRDLKRKGGVKS